MTKIRQHIITNGLQFVMTEKIGSFKVHHSPETAICVMKHPTCVLFKVSPSTESSDDDVSLTSILYIFLSCVLFMTITLLFMLQYDMSQESP